MLGCYFSNNHANILGGAIYWQGINSSLTDSTFINNTADQAGAIQCDCPNAILTDSTFIGNTAYNSGAVRCGGGVYNIIISGCNFTGNKANVGGAVSWGGDNGTLNKSTFIDNTATANGGAIRWEGVNGTMIDCNFVNNKWTNSYTKSNGIYVYSNLTINGGNGIVDLNIVGTLSGIHIIALNNQTYFCPPNENINFIEEFFEN